MILASEKTVRFPEIAVFFRILPHCVSLCDLCVCVKLQPCSSYLIVKNRNRVTMDDLTNHVLKSIKVLSKRGSPAALFANNNLFWYLKLTTFNC